MQRTDTAYIHTHASMFLGLSVCLSVCLSVLATTVSPRKTAEPVKMLFAGADSRWLKEPRYS